MNKTKIVCSIGPASCEVSTIEKMIDAGMDVARFNMSHGTYESHRKSIEAVRIASKNKKTAIGILIDTKGPEIRIKQFASGKIQLSEGGKFTLTTKEIEGNENSVSVTYKNLPSVLKKSDKVLIDDGNIELRVEKTTTSDVICTVVHGGKLSNNKSINLPGIKTNMPYMSEQDKKDLLFAKEMDADFIAISFVRYEEDVLEIKKYLKSINFKNVKIISKIENEEGVQNFDKILHQSDGIMVARGDLGVEINFVKIPFLQKEFIAKSNYHGKITITATQMLESMITNARPTRAEISDVANAVFDGSTGIMLSGETTAGQFPVEAVETMAHISLEAENYIEGLDEPIKTHNTSKSIGYAAYSLSRTDDVKAIIVVTKSGLTAENISRFRPNVPIIACTPSEKTYRQMSILYGVLPVLDKEYNSIDAVNESSFEKAIETGLVQKGDKIVLVSGLKAGTKGNNLLLIKKL